MAKAWCKVSASLDSHPRVRRAGNLGRQVFEFALRRNSELDLGGVIPGEHMEAWYLADVLMLTEADAVSGLSRAVTAGLLIETDGQYAISGWDDEWGKKAMTEAQRKRLQRARSREHEMSRKCPDTNVTESDGPECHRSEESRSEKRREEEKGENGAPSAAPASQLSLTTTGKPKRQKKPPCDASEQERAVATAVLDRLSEASGVQFRGVDPHVKLIAARLREGVSEGQLRAVVAYCADEWKGDEKMHQFLRPETLFGPTTIHKYLPQASARYAKAIADLERRQASGGAA